MKEITQERTTQKGLYYIKGGLYGKKITQEGTILHNGRIIRKRDYTGKNYIGKNYMKGGIQYTKRGLYRKKLYKERLYREKLY